MSYEHQAPTFLYLQIPAEVDARGYFAEFPELVSAAGGTLRALVTSDKVECLETGSPPSSLVVAEFDDPAGADQLLTDARHQQALEPLLECPETLVLITPGLPYQGWPDLPDIPTAASVPAPLGPGPNGYMIIQGTVHDEPRIDAYRDVILPMLKDLGAYYVVFEAEGKQRVVHGPWNHQIIAISRWPDYAAGHAFWDSDRYQNTAIPIRTGAGDFWVHFVIGTARKD